MEKGRGKGRDEGGSGEGNEEEEGRMEREIGGARRLEREIRLFMSWLRDVKGRLMTNGC